MEWKVRAIRGATTVSENSVEAIQEAVTELLDELEHANQLDPDNIISATFSVTRDLDAIFPAAIARQRPGWNGVPLMDVQHMHVNGSLERCIRLLLHVNTQASVYHCYLRAAQELRPDLSLSVPRMPSPKTGSLRGRLEAPGFRHGEESLPLKVGDALDGLEPANNLSE